MSEEKSTNPIVSAVSDFKNIALWLIAVATAYNTWQNQRISDGLKHQLAEAEISKTKVDQLSSEVRLQIDQKRFSNEQLFQLYREIKESVNDKNCDQQLLLTMIVDQVMADNISLRDSLRNFIVKKAPLCIAATYIKTEKTAEAKFESEQQKTTSLFTIDVFYLNEIEKEAKPRAEQVVGLLKGLFPTYNVRLRLLPKAVNARSGYRIEANQIRFEASEGTVAKEVYDVIVKNKVFRFEQPRLSEITFRTPNYISIFVRNM